MAKLTKRQTEAKCRELRTKEIALMQENDTLKKANENLQKVLEENGIRPQPLIVTYLVPDCYNCDCYDEAGDEELQDECYYMRCNEECPKKKKMERVSFYTYSVDGNMMQGIVSSFASEKYLEIISVIDARNGKVLFENEKFENEFSKVLKDFFEKYKIHELIEKGKEPANI